MQLGGKKILLCVTGGIAVFKAAALTSQLFKQGADVKVIMTSAAREFVTPLTFQTMSRNEVYFDTFDEKDPKKIAHIELADWADMVVIAPATANMIGKIANGIADDMISTTITATTAPVLIAPAMNSHMYVHPAVRKNMETLASFGYQFIEPGEGLLACGYVGKGRLAEPEEIVKAIHQFFSKENNSQPLAGKKVLVTAGPTIEVIDPVRYLTNRSTGKMGFAIAEVAEQLGAEVTLVTGPVSLNTPNNVRRIDVTSAEEMYNAVINEYEDTDIVIKSAAVADYRPKYVYDQKVKKKSGDLELVLERTTDILAELGKRKEHQFLVGFAAESTSVEDFALKKIEKKNLDMIVANDITQEGAGFAGDTNVVTIYRRSGAKTTLPMLNKHEVARRLFEEVLSELKEERKYDR
ncbi:bifunctional phosphopantothenoylcysteine decarboxylase/phosphopantothenate--cysteine ligase CoaBC [Pueribacillus theae]|uniref:Coenzyme A biosynthesis bifunctional protein CoaBC n=1 Tax=Pueribacillus theae TaxID=2171751 RepID=A0A2U1K7E6_9BACI|nr:bifunctional phosphopantothenoylcysteine decarboxylase/phosphopantothenate--cysteine ligase CoaBC [Pueribacillus theae]PWA13457.1 bifunctional phosphopantothenoylcysteine decarboxylase/phosphopantothenate--cysteine ligase CoaBC [Pueribacillus theae]